MQRILFNDNWAVKKQGDSHQFSLAWEKITIPHDAVIGTPRSPQLFNGTKKGFFENGAWEYVKVFYAPEEWRNKSVFLEFQGVQNHAMVYLNGSYVGKHACGYTEFALDLSTYLRAGEKNVVKVSCRTGDDSRWYTGAGLYRDVNLLVADKLHIENNGVKVKTLSADTNAAVIRVSVSISTEEPVTVKTEILSAGKTIAQSEQAAAGKSDFTFQIESPRLWSEDAPYLYVCRVSLVKDGAATDTAEECFGIRTLTVSAKEGLFLNGRQVQLRGTCIHHDNGVIGARCFKEAEYRKIRKLKEAGFNAIRSAHQPASRFLLQACDELGMLVMDEAFDVWQVPKSSWDYANDFDENWKDDIRAMVDKDFNHPSVILYSIGNEISDIAFAGGIRLANEIASEVKALDDSRFTTLAINGLLLLMQKMEWKAQLDGQTDGPQKDVNEALSSLDDVMLQINNAPSMDRIIEGGADAVDIAGYNYMHNRYEPDIDKYPNRVIVGSETYTKYIADMWAHIKSHNNVLGDFTWTGWDYLGETGIGGVSYEARDYHDGFYGVYPCITADCGDIDITGFRLPQSYYREIVFGLRKEPYIAVHDPAKYGMTEYLSTWGWGDVISSWDYADFEGKKVKVDVYSPFDVELFVNGRSVGKQVCNAQTAYRASFEITYYSGEIKAVCCEDGKSYAYSLFTPGQEIVLDVSCEAPARIGRPCFINFALTDKVGNVHIGRDAKLKLETQGCEIVGFGNGASKTEESYADNVHTTYRGRAFAVIVPIEKDACIVCLAYGEQKTFKLF